MRPSIPVHFGRLKTATIASPSFVIVHSYPERDLGRQEPLQPGTMAQEYSVDALQEPQCWRNAGNQSKRPKQRNSAPHGSKCCSARHHLAVFLRVKTGQQIAAINRAIDRGVMGNIDKLDCIAPIETPHKRDLFAAKRAAAVKPDCDQFCHPPHMVMRWLIRNRIS